MTTEHKGWIGVDLDGTLAFYDGWKGTEHIGEPVKPMLDRVMKWLEDGKDVRIFTARAWPLPSVPPDALFVLMPGLSDETIRAWQSVAFIREWCEKHIGRRLTITCQKDYGMVECYDDRAYGIIMNRGISAETLIAYNLVRVLKELGIKVTQGLEYAPAADRAVSEIRRILKAHDDVKASVDGANDAICRVKPENLNDEETKQLVIQTRVALGKAVKQLP